MMLPGVSTIKFFKGSFQRLETSVKQLISISNEELRVIWFQIFSFAFTNGSDRSQTKFDFFMTKPETIERFMSDL
jgi:hypothetical protein